MKKKGWAVLLLAVFAVMISAAACSNTNSAAQQDAGSANTAGADTSGTNTADADTADANANGTEDARDDGASGTDAAEVTGTSDAGDTGTDDAVSVQEGLTVETEVEGGYIERDGVYTIIAAGEYTFSGTLSEGRIVVDAPDMEVDVILAGVTLSSVKDSVIYVEAADEASVTAKKDTVNTLNDNRPRKIGNDDQAGNACIYSKDDLTLKGQGTLNVNASFNKGIHSKNDVRIKNLTLNVNAVGTALQGNDSVTVKSGDITLVSQEAEGIKTKKTDVSAKGNQRGIVTIEEGTVTITSADECINAAYDTVIGSAATVIKNH